MLGKDLVDLGLTTGVFTTDTDGSLVAIMPVDKQVDDGKGGKKTVTHFGAQKDGSPRKVCVRRADGTSLYITQDLGTAKRKFDDFDLARSVYVVGSEQDYHFKCLFQILRMLGFEWANECYHLSYGMVNLPEGKMKSREGTVVDADDLLLEMETLAREELLKRASNSELVAAEIDRRAHYIALAAIKFYLLGTSPHQDMKFDPKESISFDGRTGPYCLYAYARAASLVHSGADLANTEANYSALGNDEEYSLMMKLIDFPDQVRIACDELNPTRVATIVYEVAQAFNQFYQKHKVFGADAPELIKARLRLVEATMVVLRRGLALLGIDVLEQM
jgi:arginyl-tRNA synthetase